MSVRGLAGGLTLFTVEALAVIGLAAGALLISVVVLALL